jgi:hypothetical protein
VRRLRQRGRVAYVHDAVFEHVGGATFAQWERPERILSWYGGVLRYFAKHRPRAEQLAVRALVAVLAAVRAVANLPFDRRRALVCWRVAGMALRGAGREPAVSPGR